MAPKKPGRGKSPERDKEPEKVVNPATFGLFVEIPWALHEALKSAKDKTRRFKTAEVIVALETHLKQLGLWPPKEAEQED